MKETALSKYEIWWQVAQQHSGLHSQSLLNNSSSGGGGGGGLGFPPKSQIKRQKMIYHCKVHFQSTSQGLYYEWTPI